MSNDTQYQGQQAYADCRSKVFADQGNICAYCECGLDVTYGHLCRVEHVHQKSDISTTHNWALDWNNMLGVCIGGCRSAHQLPDNLSCDAYKDHKIQTGQLPLACEGWILNPLQMQAFPSLFDFDKSTGCLIPNAEDCSSITIAGNQHETTEKLVQHTINMLNLNCDRLLQERIKMRDAIEAKKKEKRKKSIPAALALQDIAQHYLQRRWHTYFTTIRCCLGQYAENYLLSINYQG